MPACRCNGGVNTALRFDQRGSLRFAALQSNAGKQLLQRSGRAPDDISSIVLVEDDASYIKSEAILRIAKHLELPFPVVAQLGLPFPLFFRDTVYDAVSNLFATSSALLHLMPAPPYHVALLAAGGKFAIQCFWTLHRMQNERCRSVGQIY